MVIESIISPESAERKPWQALLVGFMFTIVACLLTLKIAYGAGGGGFLIVAFISIAAAPMFVRVFCIEEKKRKGNIFDRHDEVIKIFGFFFIGVIVASSFFYVIAGPNISNSLFTDQLNDLCSKGLLTDEKCGRVIITGQATSTILDDRTQGITGRALAPLSFSIIFLNNIEVLILAFVFSFMLGAGAVFLISWNATIIGVLIAKIAESPLAFQSAEIIKGNMIVNYMVALPFTLLRILPHGIFEFGGYFFGAVAGGILSAAIIREKFKEEKIFPVLKDSLIYLAISFVLVFIGAIVEVVV